MKRAGGAALVAIALAMLAYRFAHLDLAPFARDEPQFLAAAREQLRTGRWLAANPLYGNLGLRYGPAAFWFYGVVLSLLGDDPRTAIVAMGLVVTLSHLAFALALSRLFDEGAAFFAVLVAWMASSPYLFLWSRLAWDLTSMAAAFCAAALLCSPRTLTPGRALALGVALGAGLATHPMVAPLAIAAVVVLGWEGREGGRKAVAAIAIVVAAMIAVNLPYLVFLAKAPIVGRAARHPVSLAGLASLALQAPRISTVWGLSYYFDEAWGDFRRWLGPAGSTLEPLALCSLSASVAAAVIGVAISLRAPDVRQRRLARVAAMAWAGNVVLLAAVGLGPHPHYHFSSAWVPLFGMAACLARLRRHRPRAGVIAVAVVAAMAVAQFLVIVRWMGYIRARGGTRSASYGTPLGLQVAAMRAVCAAPPSVIVLQNDTKMFRFPFEYLATTEPSCRGKTVLVCSADPGPLVKPCPSDTAGSRLVRLQYTGPVGGGLAVD